MAKSSKNNVSKVYCEKCDLIFESHKSFEKHFDSHSSKFVCETCPIDIITTKIVNLFKLNSSRNLE